MSKQKTETVANTRIPGVADDGDLERLKAEAVDLMVRSADLHRRHEELAAEASDLLARHNEARWSSRQARDEAAVLRLRAGGAFRQVREALKPLHQWDRWRAGLKEAHGWSKTVVDEAIEMWELSGGDESKVAGLGVTDALGRLRSLRERDEGEAARRRERARKGAETKRLRRDAQLAIAAKEAPPGTVLAIRGLGYDPKNPPPLPGEATQPPLIGLGGATQEPQPDNAGAAARLAEVLGPAFDPGPLSGPDLAKLDFLAARPSPGLSRLVAAWEAATAEDRRAFLDMVEEGRIR